MKKLLIYLSVAFIACNNPVKPEKEATDHKQGHEAALSDTALPLPAGSKWKADEATKKNVAAMMREVSDSSYANASNKKKLLANMQNHVDTLIKQCIMKGADHEALHTWLEKVLTDMKEMKEDDDYAKGYRALKSDIQSFYDTFE